MAGSDSDVDTNVFLNGMDSLEQWQSMGGSSSKQAKMLRQQIKTLKWLPPLPAHMVEQKRSGLIARKPRYRHVAEDIDKSTKCSQKVNFAHDPAIGVSKNSETQKQKQKQKRNDLYIVQYRKEGREKYRFPPQVIRLSDARTKAVKNNSNRSLFSLGKVGLSGEPTINDRSSFTWRHAVRMPVIAPMKSTVTKEETTNTLAPVIAVSKTYRRWRKNFKEDSNLTIAARKAAAVAAAAGNNDEQLEFRLDLEMARQLCKIKENDKKKRLDSPPPHRFGPPQHVLEDDPEYSLTSKEIKNFATVIFTGRNQCIYERRGFSLPEDDKRSVYPRVSRQNGRIIPITAIPAIIHQSNANASTAASIASAALSAVAAAGGTDINTLAHSVPTANTCGLATASKLAFTLANNVVASTSRPKVLSKGSGHRASNYVGDISSLLVSFSLNDKLKTEAVPNKSEKGALDAAILEKTSKLSENVNSVNDCDPALLASGWRNKFNKLQEREQQRLFTQLLEQRQKRDNIFKSSNELRQVNSKILLRRER